MNAQLLLAATKAQLLFGASDKGISGLLKNITTTVESWGDYVLILVGLILIAYGAIALFKAIKGLGGQGQGGGAMDWAKAILAIVIGILLTATNIAAIKKDSPIGQDTIHDALSGNG